MKIAPFQIEQYIKNIASAKVAGALIFGHDESVISYHTQTIAKKIVADLSDPFLVVNLTKERFAQDSSCLADEFYSFSMLGGRKLIMIRDTDANVSASIKALFAKKDEILKSENFILIQGGDLEKSSALRKLAEENQHFAAIACYEDDERVIKKFIENEMVRNEIDADPDCVSHLYDKLGKNRQIIISELDKIATYLDGDTLSAAVIDRAIGSEAAISVNEFINNFVEKNLSASLEQANYLLKNDFEAITLIRFLLNYLQKLYHAKIETDIVKTDFETAIKAQRLFFKAEADFRKQLKSINLSKIITWLNALEALEIKIKTTSKLSPKLLFTVFVQESLSA